MRSEGIALATSYRDSFVFDEIVHVGVWKQFLIRKLHFIESLLKIYPGLLVLPIKFRKRIHRERAVWAVNSLKASGECQI